jgi:hypothetical protein
MSLTYDEFKNGLKVSQQFLVLLMIDDKFDICLTVKESKSPNISRSN